MHYAKIALCKTLHFFQLKIPIKPPHGHTSFADFNMFECDYCEKVFTLKSNLYRHVRKYHQDKQLTNDYPRAAKIRRLEDTHQPQPYQSTNPYQHQSINPYGHQPFPYHHHQLYNPYGHQLYYHPFYFPYFHVSSQPNASSQSNVSSQLNASANASSQPSATQPNDSIQQDVSIQKAPQTPPQDPLQTPPQTPPQAPPQPPQAPQTPPQPQTSNYPPKRSKTCEICGKKVKYPRNKKLHMETAHGIKMIRGEGKSRKDIIQIYQHDGNAKMTVQETNQVLVKARDEIIIKLYEALQKCKQGIKYDTQMELVFQRSRMNDKGEMENVMTSPVYRKDKIEELLKQEKIGDIEERFDVY